MATDKPRYSITLDEELFKEVEDFRFERRYQTRNQATVELIRLGLAEIKSSRNHPDFHSIRDFRKFVFHKNKSLAKRITSSLSFSLSHHLLKCLDQLDIRCRHLQIRLNHLSFRILYRNRKDAALPDFRLHRSQESGKLR